MADKNIPDNVNSEVLGKIKISQKILTFPNEINSRRNPRFDKEKIKKRKEKKAELQPPTEVVIFLDL